MARSRRQRSEYARPSVTHHNTHRVTSYAARPIHRIRPRVILNAVEDRRLYHPSHTYRPLKTVSGTRVTPLRVGKVSAPVRRERSSAPSPFRREPRLPHTIQFDVPKRTIICLRRKRRKEVLFALNQTGGGARRRRNQWSDVSC